MSTDASLDPAAAAPGVAPADDGDARFAEAYPELRRLAHARLARDGRPDGLQTTVVVHECYLRLASQGLTPEHRRAFFAYASKVMRSIIVDTARAQLALRRGGDLQATTLDTMRLEGLAAPGSPDEVSALHDALIALEAAEPRLAKVVEMRYFGGYTELEIAEALGVTDRTVRRDWDKARLLLLDLLEH